MDAEEEALRNERRLNALLTIHRQLANLMDFVDRIGMSLESLSLTTVRYIREQNLVEIDQPQEDSSEATEADSKNVGKSDAEKWAKRKGDN